MIKPTNEINRRINEAVDSIERESQTGQVILVFGLGSYGDVIQITPLLRSLRKTFPQATFILVHSDSLGSKLLESVSYLKKHIRIPAGYHYLLRNKLKEHSYDLLVECRYVIKYTLSIRPRFNREQLQFIEDAQKIQTGWLGKVQNFPYDNDFLCREARAAGWSMYELMAHTSGFPDEDFEALQIDLPDQETALARFSLPSDYIVVSNAAEWLPLQGSLWTKSLPHARMREILSQLKTLAIPTLLLGTTNDPGNYPVDHDLRGKTNLLEAAGLIKGARLLLGPEGGLVNLARAVETPSVVFFGSTPLEFFGMKSNINIAPRICGGCWWSTASYLRQCPLLEEVPPCTNSIEAKQVVAVVEQLFEARRFSYAN